MRRTGTAVLLLLGGFGCSAPSISLDDMGTCGEKGGPGTTCYATDGCSIAGGAPLLMLAIAALARRRRR